MTPRNARVAVVQEPPVFLNARATTERAVDLIGKLAEQGAKLIVFPETWLPGYPVWLDYASDAALWDHPPARTLYRILRDNAVAEGDELLGTLWQASMQHEVNVVIGAHERDGGTHGDPEGPPAVWCRGDPQPVARLQLQQRCSADAADPEGCQQRRRGSEVAPEIHRGIEGACRHARRHRNGGCKEPAC